MVGSLLSDLDAMGRSPKLLELVEKRSAEVAGLLKALAHPARLRIVATLLEGENSVGELEQKLGVHQPSLSQQLGVLRSAQLVETRREFKQIFYRLTEEKAALLIEALATIFVPAKKR
jgi:ArsR family transcriptional regulator